MSKYCLGLTEKQINDVIKELGLKDSHDNDQYIAAYHILNPSKVGCDNYKQKLEQRRIDLENGYAPPVRRTRTVNENALRGDCDAILCDLENGDLHKLGDLTKKQCNMIKDIILHGVSGNEEYFESVEEMKEISPEYYHIWTLIEQVTPKRKIDPKKVIAKKLKKIGLATEVGSIVSKADPKELFGNKYSTFVFYNVKNSNLIIAKCGNSEDRFRGTKTLLGDIVKYRVNSKMIPKFIGLRSVKSIVESLPVRKPSETDAVQLNSDTVLLKVFK